MKGGRRDLPFREEEEEEDRGADPSASRPLRRSERVHSLETRCRRLKDANDQLRASNDVLQQENSQINRVLGSLKGYMDSFRQDIHECTEKFDAKLKLAEDKYQNSQRNAVEWRRRFKALKKESARRSGEKDREIQRLQRSLTDALSRSRRFAPKSAVRSPVKDRSAPSAEGILRQVELVLQTQSNQMEGVWSSLQTAFHRVESLEHSVVRWRNDADHCQAMEAELATLTESQTAPRDREKNLRSEVLRLKQENESLQKRLLSLPVEPRPVAEAKADTVSSPLRPIRDRIRELYKIGFLSTKERFLRNYSEMSFLLESIGRQAPAAPTVSDPGALDSLLSRLLLVSIKTIHNLFSKLSRMDRSILLETAKDSNLLVAEILQNLHRIFSSPSSSRRPAEEEPAIPFSRTLFS